jgi:hypothetical protein
MLDSSLTEIKWSDAVCGDCIPSPSEAISNHLIATWFRFHLLLSQPHQRPQTRPISFLQSVFFTTSWESAHSLSHSEELMEAHVLTQ